MIIIDGQFVIPKPRYKNIKEAKSFYSKVSMNPNSGNYYADSEYNPKEHSSPKVLDLLNKLKYGWGDWNNSPTDIIVNLGPLYGKWTPEVCSILKPEVIIYVDIIDDFFDHLINEYMSIVPTIKCFKNKGDDLDAIPDNSVDRIFSIDALTVGINDRAMSNYIKEFNRVLKHGGKCLLHIHISLKDLIGKQLTKISGLTITFFDSYGLEPSYGCFVLIEKRY